MASLLDRCGVACATTLTGSLVLGAALGAVAPNLCSFMDFPTAGAVDQKTYRYLILDSNGSWEFGKGVYTASGTTLTRTVKFSSNSNAAISLSGNSQVFVSADTDDVLSFSDDQTSFRTQNELAQGRVNLGAAPIAAMAALVMNQNIGVEVSQENGTSSVTLTGTGSLQTKYIVDGVMAAYRGTFVATAQQVTDAPAGFVNSVKFTVGTAEASLGANDELSVVIPIEGLKTARLSFGNGNANVLAVWMWLKVHRTGTYSGSYRNGGKTRSYPFNFTINAADTWQYVPILIAGDQTGTWATDTTVGGYLTIAIAAGSSRVGTAGAWAGVDVSGATSTTNGVAATTDVFQITGVGTLPMVAGVSVGDIPSSAQSPFIVRPFDLELGLWAERYYAKTFPYSTKPAQATGSTVGAALASTEGTSTFAINWPRSTRMRGGGAVTTFNPVSAAINIRDTNNSIDRTISSTVAEENGVQVVGLAGAVNGLNYVHIVNDARLA